MFSFQSSASNTVPSTLRVSLNYSNFVAYVLEESLLVWMMKEGSGRVEMGISFESYFVVVSGVLFVLLFLSLAFLLFKESFIP